MALTYLGGLGAWFPDRLLGTLTTTLGSLGTINATGEKLAISGYVWWPGDKTGTKDVQRVWINFGAVTKSGGSALTLSLQNLSATAPLQPDETQDQTVAIANADAGFDANRIYRSGTLSADRTVNYRDLLSVVVEYDVNGRLSSDTVDLRGVTVATRSENANGASLKTAAWAGEDSRRPVCILEFDDGTFGTLGECVPVSVLTSASIDTGTSPDEVALKFTPTVPMTISALGAMLDYTNSSTDFELVLYSGTDALVTVAVDASQLITTGGGFAFQHAPIAETDLSAGTAYYIAVKPTTTNNVVVAYYDVSDANHLTIAQGGTAYHYASRENAGAWTPLTTRRPLISMRVAKVDNGASVGGGSGLTVGSLGGGIYQ